MKSTSMHFCFWDECMEFMWQSWYLFKIMNWGHLSEPLYQREYVRVGLPAEYHTKIWGQRDIFNTFTIHVAVCWFANYHKIGRFKTRFFQGGMSYCRISTTIIAMIVIFVYRFISIKHEKNNAGMFFQLMVHVRNIQPLSLLSIKKRNFSSRFPWLRTCWFYSDITMTDFVAK